MKEETRMLGIGDKVRINSPISFLHREIGQIIRVDPDGFYKVMITDSHAFWYFRKERLTPLFLKKGCDFEF